MVYIPAATYRLQISPNFTLKDVQQLIPYLQELGVSTLYAAPFFTSKPGSEHGYDVTNPDEINPNVGTLEELREIARALQERGMGWLQDIVPNHMAYHPENKWLMDVLEKGPQSPFYCFFDIDFDHPDFDRKVMAPFLGEPLEKVLEQKQIGLSFGGNGFAINYFDSAYPASIASYTFLLEQARQQAISKEARHVAENMLLQVQQHATAETLEIHVWNEWKQQFYKKAQQTPALLKTLNLLVESINGDKKQLQQLLALQHYKLSHWQQTAHSINYRRFFTVNDLICLSMEQPEVFDRYHRFIKKLCDEGLVQGLRVDHVDGLFDPTTYLKRLRKLAGPNTYLVVEKILEGEEHLPERWPIQGNSGYDFLAQVSNLYTSASGRRKLTAVYGRLAPNAAANYKQLVYDKKLYILHNNMAGELSNLLRILQESALIPQSPEQKWRKALAALLAAFPVYCIYSNRLPLPPEEQHVIDQAFEEARRQAPEVEEQLAALYKLFALEEGDSEERRDRKLYFVMRSQQFTGPLAAKGVEDTTFYNYNRLISLNEVGNSPDIFHLEDDEFHERMMYKLRTYPHSLNATATHDTKRGEGARIRLNVLSELPGEWENHVTQWLEISKKYTSKPTTNDLYFIFQTMLGVLPLDGAVDETLIQRVQEYLTKALREAKVKTDWVEPNEPYEQAVTALVQQLLQEDEDFMASFMPFFRKLAHYGWLYALCQTILKLTCPGVPDVYQGTELWDLSLVDPDNRRPVDYEQRRQFLQEIKQQEQNPEQLHAQLLQHPEDGQVKLYLLYKALNTRRAWQPLFDFGDYIPLKISGTYKHHVLAFARRHGQQWCVVAAPLLLASLLEEDELPLGEQVWEDTAIELPADAPAAWRHVYGQEEILAEGSLPLASVLKTFPVGFLTATAS